MFLFFLKKHNCSVIWAWGSLSHESWHDLHWVCIQYSGYMLFTQAAFVGVVTVACDILMTTSQTQRESSLVALSTT